MKEHERLLILHLTVQTLDEIVGIAVRQKQVEIPIIVIVEKLKSPSAHQPCRHSDSGTTCLIVKCFVVIVLVDRETLEIDVGYEQIHPSILVEIRGIQSHTRASPTVIAVSHPPRGAVFFKANFSAVHENKVRCSVIADKRIE